jgi:hypothetical protein
MKGKDVRRGLYTGDLKDLKRRATMGSEAVKKWLLP